MSTETATLEQRAAELLADRAQQELGSLDSITCIPISMAAQLAGVTQAYILRSCPIVEHPGKPKRIRLSVLKDWIKSRERQPKK